MSGITVNPAYEYPSLEEEVMKNFEHVAYMDCSSGTELTQSHQQILGIYDIVSELGDHNSERFTKEVNEALKEFDPDGNYSFSYLINSHIIQDGEEIGLTFGDGLLLNDEYAQNEFGLFIPSEFTTESEIEHDPLTQVLLASNGLTEQIDYLAKLGVLASAVQKAYEQIQE